MKIKAYRFLITLFLAVSYSLSLAPPALSSTAVPTATGAKLGSPINGENGKIYVADQNNSRLFVITIASNAVSTISLPGQPVVLGGSLSISKDKALMAVPLASGSIAIVNLSTDQVVSSYGLSGKVPQSTAFGAANSIVFFSTNANFDDVYVLNTGTSSVVKHFGLDSGLTSDGTDLELMTSSDGTKIYVLERFGSPGGLHKIDVTDPLNPVFLATDSHGSLGSNCRGLALIPGGVAAPTQGHEAYIACGSPYYIQAISQSGALLYPATQFATGAYPVGVDTFSNGDVAALIDASAPYKSAFIFDSGGTEKTSYAAQASTYYPTDDGIAAAFFNDQKRVYMTMCASNDTSPNNCFVQYAGDDADPSPTPTPVPTATPVPTPTSNGLVTLTVSKTSFPKSGGALTITSKIKVGGYISATKATVHAGTKTLNVPMKTIPGKALQYKGIVTLPKNTTKKPVVWQVVASAKINGTSEISGTKKVTVAK